MCQFKVWECSNGIGVKNAEFVGNCPLRTSDWGRLIWEVCQTLFVEMAVARAIPHPMSMQWTDVCKMGG